VKLYQIREYSKTSIKGRRWEVFLVSLIIPSVISFFRLAELCIASVVLYLSDITPMELFYNSPFLWGLLVFIERCLEIIMISAVMSPVIKCFSGIFDIELPEQKNTVLFRKNILFVILFRFISFISLIPAVISGYLFAGLIIKGYEYSSSGAVFLTIHAGVLVIISVFFWIWIVLGMTAVPFLSARNSGKGVIRLIPVSFRVMKNSRRGLFRIILFYIMTVFIPFGFIYYLPEFFSSLTLYINICIKEVEYVGGKNIYSRNRKSHDRSKISERGKKRLKASPDEA